MLKELLDLVLPACCAGCGTPGEILCVWCQRGMASPIPVERAKGPPMFALARYDGAARRAVIAYKERGRRELAVPFGRLLGCALPVVPAATAIVPAPSRAGAARKRGGQHMYEVAKHAGVDVWPVLRLSRWAKDSVGLDVRARTANLAGRLTCAPLRERAEVIVVDDVITTGATAAACCAALTRAGAKVTAVLALTAT
jgi:predicted amidophosphoribosyltransferase